MAGGMEGEVFAPLAADIFGITRPPSGISSKQDVGG